VTRRLDAAHKEVVALLSARLENSGGNRELLHLIFVSRSLERIGDLASTSAKTRSPQRGRDIRTNNTGMPGLATR